MARDSNGNYTLPASVNPVVGGTKITVTWAITTLGDIATALTGSLPRDGSGAATAPIKFISGSAAAPGIVWASESTSGWYRAGAGDFRYAIGAVDILKITASGLQVPDVASGTMYRVGFREIVPVPQSAAYTITPTSAGKCIRHPGADTTARAWVLQANATSAWPDGAAVTILNKNGAGALTITAGDTMYLAGAGTTGARTLAPNGICTAIWDAVETNWTISGTGLT